MTIKPDCRNKSNTTISFICSQKNQIHKNCDNPTIRANIVTNLVLEEVRKQCQKIVFDKKELEEIFATVDEEINIEKYKIQKEIDKINRKIDTLDTQIKAVYEDKLNGVLLLDDFFSIYNAKNKEKEKLVNKQKELLNQLQEQEKVKNVDYEELKEFASEFLKMENPTKEVITNLIETITVSKGRKIKIKYKFSKT